MNKTYKILKQKNIRNKMFNLQSNILDEIYQFDTFKYDFWEKVMSLFLKGGFITIIWFHIAFYKVVVNLMDVSNRKLI